MNLENVILEKILLSKKGKRQFEKDYKQGKKPSISELDGLFDVILLGLPSLPGHIKIIKDGSGFNVIAGIRWGYFKIKDGDGEVIFDYDVVSNDPSLRKIKDHVRLVTLPHPEGLVYYGKLEISERMILNFELKPVAASNHNRAPLIF